MLVRVAVIGAGGNARGHVRRLMQIDDAAVSGIYDIDRSHARGLADMCGSDIFESVAHAVDKSDAVFVCSWTAAHPEAVRAAVAAERPVFCEKPLATSLAAAQEITQFVRASGVTNQIGLALRWRPEFRLLQQLMADPGNGRLLSVCLHTAMPGRTRVLTGWRADADRAGGGVLLEVGFHDIDVLEWLVGPSTTVAAQIQWSEYAGIDDAAALSLTFANGCVGSLSVTWHDADTAPPSRHLQVVFERTRYLLAGTHVEGWGVDGPLPVPDAVAPDGSAAGESGESAEEAFLAAAGAGRMTAPDFSAGLRVHQVLDAAYRSAGAGGSAQGVENAHASA